LKFEVWPKLFADLDWRQGSRPTPCPMSLETKHLGPWVKTQDQAVTIRPQNNSTNVKLMIT